jgi:hypothetical protein
MQDRTHDRSQVEREKKTKFGKKFIGSGKNDQSLRSNENLNSGNIMDSSF